MDKEKRKTKKKTFILSIFPILAVFIPLVATAFSVVSAAVITIDENNYYTYTYTKKDEEENVLYELIFKWSFIGNTEEVAIKWSEDNNPSLYDPEDYPEVLEIPKKVTDDADESVDKTEYTVTAIAAGGFKHTQFKEFDIPDSVTVISPEAFAYCQELTEIVIPKNVDEIAPSTFLDCRELTKVYYQDSSGDKTFSNSKITKLGDHAFDSCVKLNTFYCPDTVVEIGKSCFQKCKDLVKFSFPTTDDNDNRDIVVESYAFADCENLREVYFETNVKKIGNHAFSDCHNSLAFSFYGDNVELGLETEGTYTAEQKRAAAINYLTNKFSESGLYNHWRDVLITTSDDSLIDINPLDDPIRKYLDCFTYTYGSGQIKLDSAGENTTEVYFNKTSDTYYDADYVIITGFQSTVKVADHYEYYNGTNADDGYTLTIPNTIKNKKVKIIQNSAITNNLNISKIVFNKDLVQIRRNAFLGCNVIQEMDFSKCETLKEISYAVFQTPRERSNQEIYNEVLTSLDLPSSLEYLGDFAFYNFTKLEESISFGSDSKLKVIGAYAIAINRNVDTNKLSNNANIDLVLPWTLSDKDALDANYYNFFGKTDKDNRYMDFSYCAGRRYAIGTHAFDNATTIRSVTMEQKYVKNATTNKDEPIVASYTTSLASNVFVRAKNLLRFKSNRNLCNIGNDCFKGLTELREIFLVAETANSKSTVDYPWGLNDTNTSYKGPLFTINGNNIIHEAVVYIQDSSAPKKNGNPDSTVVNQWNVSSKENSTPTTTYVNELGFSDDYSDSGRTELPTFYNVDFLNKYTDSVLYYRPKTGVFVGEPITKDDYNKGEASNGNGLITFVKNGSGNFEVGRYYCSSPKSEIDLTGIVYDNGTPSNLTDDINISNKLVKIGDGAFGTNATNKAPGKYFVLPNCVEVIGERAFYRRGSGYGVITITYKNGNTKVAPAGYSYNTNATKGYCYLPSSVTTIKRSAFYYNKFGAVVLSKNISFIGNSSFYTTGTAQITSISTDSGSGLYSHDGSEWSPVEHYSFGVGLPVQKSVNGYYYVDTYDDYSLYRKGEWELLTSISGSGDPNENSDLDVAVEDTYYIDCADSDSLQVYIKTDSLTASWDLIEDVDVTIGTQTPIDNVEGGNNELYVLVPPSDGDYYLYRSNPWVKIDDNVSSGNGSPITGEVAGSSGDYYIDKTPAFGSNSRFSLINGGVYYNISATKTLVYQAAGTETSLNIASGTKAIGLRACANTNYNSLVLPDGIKTIYGSAFKNCSNLASISGNGIDDLRYISAVAPNDEVYSYNTHGAYFDNFDFQNINSIDMVQKLAQHSAFANCSSLTDVNFRNMDNLKRIGRGAFKGCSSLANVAGNHTYSFSTENSTKSSGVLDLRRIDNKLKNLTHIGYNAFTNCDAIDYILLPDTTGGETVHEFTTTNTDVFSDGKYYARDKASSLYVGTEGVSAGSTGLTLSGKTFGKSSGKPTILTGETVIQVKSSVSGSSTNPGSHYVSGCFNDCNVYYYAAYKDDIDLTQPSYKYWTYNGNDYSFTLFDDAASALLSLNKHPRHS